MSPTHRTRHAPPLALTSALLLLLGDWLAFALNIWTEMDAYWLMVGCCVLAAAAAITAIEAHVDGEPLRIALIRGCSAAAIIALPLPLAGTLTGLTFLTWWCIDYLVQRRTRHRADSA